MAHYPIEYPPGIPDGLTPSRCTGCKKLWWVSETPPEQPGHCMGCGGKLRWLIASVSSPETV